MNRQAEATRLVGEYSDLIVRLCHSYLQSTADAEDICQEVLLKALDNRQRFTSTEHEKAWIIRVTCNKCKDLLRSPARRLRAEEAEAVDKPAPSYGPLTDAIATLPRDQRIAVYLHYYEGYRAAEIAEMLPSTPDAVYQILSRARATLRESLIGDRHA
ncbi:RNA polymerase sigma factor [Corynebacterium sp. H130]|uniref:RNA polymerase sigma factor n=1 Tax=Corynebacterium sp. H130 TaxID=3133444 RepID=UPI0030AEE12F